MLDEQRQEARAHIEEIRREKFGLRGRHAQTNPLSGDLQAALDNLSEKLYAQQHHYIFELIQNAEDNDYPESTSAELSFELHSEDPTNTPRAEGALVVKNNERGFLKKHVEALCSVGGTTKDKSSGYIGEKGIGFKSVFLISEDPHIFSRGYSFHLPKEHQQTGLGYIVPCWQEEVPNCAESDGTTLILPLKKGRFADVANQLREFAPETILFLRKLHMVHIEIEQEYRATIVKESDSDRKTVDLLYEKQGQPSPAHKKHWLQTETHRKPDGIEAEHRARIEDRDITVACPLSDGDKRNDWLFAYLPTEVDAQLPFLLNADFVLTSNRESIRTDEAWNVWLRDCAPQAAINGLSSLLKSSYWASGYACIPLPNKVQNSFFRSVAETVLDRLKEMPLVRVRGGRKLVRPQNARRANKRLRDLFAIDGGPTFFDETPLVDGATEEFSEQLKALGVPSLSKDEVIKCLKDADWLAQRDPSWFVECYRYLAAVKWDEAEEERLCECPIILTQDGDLVASADRPTYFSLSEDDRSFVRDIPSECKIDAVFLHPQIAEELREDQEVRQFLRTGLVVSDFNHMTYCWYLIRHLEESYQTLSAKEIVRPTLFLAEHGVPQKGYDRLPVILSDGQMHTLRDLTEACEDDDNPVQCVATPTGWDPETGWQNVFCSEEDRRHIAVTSDLYLSECSSTDGVQDLFDFFRELGVSDAPNPRKTKLVCRSALSSGNEYERSLFRDAPQSSKGWNRMTYNVRPPSWLQQLAAGEAVEGLEAKSRSLAKWLRRSKSAEWEQARVEYHYYNWKKEPYPSEFLVRLRESEWIDSTKGHRCPSEVFVDKKSTREVLGESVPYLKETLPEKIIELLNVRKEVTTDELLDMLEQMSGKSDPDTELIRKIYRRLDVAESYKEIADRFAAKPLIFVPEPALRWCLTEEALWVDRSDVRGSDYVYLEGIYPQLERFFCKKLGVKSDLNVKSYADQWRELYWGAAGPERARTVLEEAYEKLLPLCERIRAGGTAPDWWDKFKADVRMLCQDGKLRRTSRAYVPDDAELAEQFAESGVHFVWFPPEEGFARYRCLFELLGISYLTESVSVRVEEGVSKECREGNSYLTDGAKLIVQGKFHEIAPEDFRSRHEEGILGRLWHTREVGVDSVTVIYRLRSSSIRHSTTAHWDVSNERLLIQHEATENQIREDAAMAIAQALMPQADFRNLQDFIESALSSSLDRARRRFRNRGWNRNLAYGENLIKPGYSSLEVSEPEEPEDSIPRRPVRDRNRRQEKVAEQYGETPRKRSEVRPRRVPVDASVAREEKRTYLKGKYARRRGDDNAIICQLCSQRMPFKKRNGEDYFDARELAPDITGSPYRATALGLCPVCSAKYSEYVHKDGDKQRAVVEDILALTEPLDHPITVTVNLDEPEEIQFNEAHFVDIQTVLQRETENKNH